jgi:hypothetical protein
MFHQHFIINNEDLFVLGILIRSIGRPESPQIYEISLNKQTCFAAECNVYSFSLEPNNWIVGDALWQVLARRGVMVEYRWHYVSMTNRDCSVGITIGYGVDGLGIGFRFPGLEGYYFFFLSTASVLARGPSTFLSSVSRVFLFLVGKVAGAWIWSFPSGAKIPDTF